MTSYIMLLYDVALFERLNFDPMGLNLTQKNAYAFNYVFISFAKRQNGLLVKKMCAKML